jgi:hypothetical protein
LFTDFLPSELWLRVAFFLTVDPIMLYDVASTDYLDFFKALDDFSYDFIFIFILDLIFLYLSGEFLISSCSMALLFTSSMLF